jgi:hypothetical protein
MLNGKAKAAEKAKVPAKKVKAQAIPPVAVRATTKSNGGHSLTVPMIAPHEAVRSAAQP